MATVDQTDSDNMYFYEVVSGTLDNTASDSGHFQESATVFKGTLPYLEPYHAKFINDRYSASIFVDPNEGP